MSEPRVLVVGSGAREHALCWRLASEGARVIAAPGNILMASVAEARGHISMGDIDAVVALAVDEAVDLVVVGPEAPLVEGIVDRLAAAGIPAFGPTAAAARIEASKAFARDVCRAAGVRMAMGAAFESVDAALEYADMLGTPIVVKADGLAAGKGVAICSSLAEAERHIRQAVDEGRFGESGRRVVIEQWLNGVEASVIAVCDGRNARLLPAARDHKRLLDEDRGPNTGGMGAYSPVPELDNDALTTLNTQMFQPVLRELERRGTPFRGALFAGLMLTADGPRVLEFNARLGDPETQVILARLAEPLLPLLTTELNTDPLIRVDGQATVGITLAASGYPDSPRRGDAIAGLDAAREQGVLVFGAGLARGNDEGDEAGPLLTAGGRVLTVVGRGSDVAEAADVAYRAAELIEFDGRQMRRDIGRTPVGAVA